MTKQLLASIGDEGVLNATLPLSLSEVWIDRDLSWLDFNDRVLAEALDSRTPLLERAKFLAIFTSNLDEFFMKRGAVLQRSLVLGHNHLQRHLRKKIVDSLDRQAECYRDVLLPELSKHGITISRWDDLSSDQQEEASVYFDASVSAALTPLVIDPEHPFPFLSNLSTSLVFKLQDVDQQAILYGRVKVPGGMKQWISLEHGAKGHHKLFVPLHEIIRGNLHKLFSGMLVTGITLMRLTRDAEVETEDVPTEGIREQVREQVRQRRYEPVVRLEFGPGSDRQVKEMLQERFKLAPTDMFDLSQEVDYTTLFELASMPIPELRDPSWTPLPVAGFSGGPKALFAAIKAGDILVHHPYDSFDETVEHFISTAANDPQTISIKMTAYRIGDDTPFVQSLIRAAEHGKQVACVMEIKARFDEERNLHWAAELERVGAHVTFGMAGLKTHAKTALVVRKEENELRCYVHIATGNYHVKTARLYADVGLFTCNPDITRDVVNLFHYLTGHSRTPDFSSLLVAPSTMRPRLLELIDREIERRLSGGPSRIIAKMNQLEDPDIIEALCKASQAGVPIDLIVRGFCCLRPGVKGITETIAVRSIIGRFLEHSRIFYFANANHEPLAGEFFIGSADWMTRNLSKRIEVVTPVLADGPRHRLWTILDICLRDTRQAWVLGADGNYSQIYPDKDLDSPESLGTHQELMNLAHLRIGA
jgi:polyphosphate kinase